MKTEFLRTHRWPSGPEELQDCFEYLITEDDCALVLQFVPEESRKTPLTTCFIYNWCQSTHHAVCTPGSYRLSLEPRANINANIVGYQALAPFRKAISEPELVGRGAEGQRWLCLVDLELLYEGYFERLAGKTKTPLTPLHTFTYVIESLYPETRSVPLLPGILTLSSPQRHTLFLWVAVHRYIMYLKDPANTDVKKLLEEGVYVERAFPKDLFPALTGQALYRDAETRGYRGRASNGSYAELHWSQVSLRKLSEAIKMSDELVKAVEKEEVEKDKVDYNAVSDHEKDDSEVDLKAVARASGGATAGNRRKRSVKINEIVDKGPSTRKRTRRAPPNRPPDPQPMLGTPFKLKFKPKPPPPRPHKAFSEDTSAPKATEQSPDSPIIAASASDLDIEDEERQRKQAELAWVKYLRGPHCS